MRVSLFVTCLADQLWPAAAVGAVRVLRRMGCDVQFDERQTCCGQPAFNTGYRPEACALARRLIEIFESSGSDAIVSPSGSCTAMLHHYEQLFEDAAWRARARGLAEGTHELRSFLVTRPGGGGCGGLGGRELPDADRRPAVAPRIGRPRPAPGGSSGLHHMSFDREARAALADGQLRGALRHATTLFAERRRAAIADVPDWEGARDRARAITDETLLHLDRYLAQFAANAERAGARVHWARDAAEACEIIARIAERRGARTIVKSKSMASEEIHLNAALARRGMEPVETDLGEYIVH